MSKVELPHERLNREITDYQARQQERAQQMAREIIDISLPFAACRRDALHGGYLKPLAFDAIAAYLLEKGVV